MSDIIAEADKEIHPLSWPDELKLEAARIRVKEANELYAGSTNYRLDLIEIAISDIKTRLDRLESMGIIYG
jgi:hypothetical protein